MPSNRAIGKPGYYGPVAPFAGRPAPGSRTPAESTMHEWALAEAVIARTVEVAEAHGMAAVEEVVIRLGELQDVDRDAFEFSLGVLQAQTPRMGGTVFTFETEPAELECRPCGRTWLLSESTGGMSADDLEAMHLLPEAVHIYVTCPSCASPDFAVVKGRGVSLGPISG